MPDKRKTSTAILISGRGSNMSALIAAARDPLYPARIDLVFSNRSDAAGLTLASDAGITTAHLSSRAFGKDREAFERALDEQLQDRGIELVCLAGFMRILTPWFVDRWRDRLINIHPSLLPSFKGLDTHRRALEAGVKLHGCTVHFVRSEMDEGPIIGQKAVPVFDNDTEEALAARVLEAEHALYPSALAQVAGDALTIQGERVFRKP